jgi:hypothetical protein
VPLGSSLHWIEQIGQTKLTHKLLENESRGAIDGFGRKWEKN